MKKKNKQKPTSKEMHIEVFERDKFTCQLCGRKPPNVFLEIIRIKPKSADENDKISNFKTSCYECNKTDVNSSRKPTEKEKQEQKDLMLKWEESIIEQHKNTANRLIEHIEEKIGFCLSEPEKRIIEKLIIEFDMPDILTAIDISAKKYLLYDQEKKLVEDSIEDFVKKIGGILYNQRKPSIETKLKYISVICRNKFHPNESQSEEILHSFVITLAEYGYKEEKIYEKLATEIELKTKEISNYPAWKVYMENYIRDIKSWKRPQG